MAFSTGSNGTLSCEINVTPLIDVLLVLLIIFMVIAPAAMHGLETATTGPASQVLQPPAPDESPVLIEVGLATPNASPDSQPALCVDGRRLGAEPLEEQLRTALNSRSRRQVLIRADAKFAFGVVADLVDHAHAAGADTVGMLGGSPNGCLD